MAISEELLEGYRKYARIEDGDVWTYDLPIVTPLLEAAISYLHDAGVDEPSEDETGDKAKYNLCVWGLTLHWYDHRDSVGTEATLPLGLRPILQQLKLAQEARAALDAVAT